MNIISTLNTLLDRRSSTKLYATTGTIVYHILYMIKHIWLQMGISENVLFQLNMIK